MGVDIAIIKPFVLEKKHHKDIDFAYADIDSDLIKLKSNNKVGFFEFNNNFIDNKPEWVDNYLLKNNKELYFTYKRNWLFCRRHDFFDIGSKHYKNYPLGYYSTNVVFLENLYAFRRFNHKYQNREYYFIQKEKKRINNFLDLIEKHEKMKLITIIW